jgi:hypothetical protein
MSFFQPRFHIRDIVKFTAIVCLVLALFSWMGWGVMVQADWTVGIIYPLAVAMLCAFSVMKPRPGSPRCESCGKKFYRSSRRPSDLCPACRTAKAPPQERRRLAIQGFVIIVGLLLLLSCLLTPQIGLFLWGRFGAFAGPLVIIAGFAILLAACIAGLVVRSLVTMRRMNSPRHALRVARECAGDAGWETNLGSVSIHHFGADDLTSLFEDQFEASRKRFESLAGEPIEVDRPLRILVFGRKSSFEGFFQRAFLYSSNLDGMYVPWSMPTIALATEFPPYRLTNLERIAGVLLTYHHLDSFRKSPSPSWLQIGIGNLLASGGDGPESARLNRKMLAALSRGDSLEAAGFFHVSRRALVKFVRDWQEFDSFRRYSQLVAQSCSVVEYLCAEGARRQRFRDFLKEPAKRARTEEVFQFHFGHGFEGLLEQWRTWVQERGIGVHEPAPTEIRETVTNWVIPIIEDRGADLQERIQAIRELGKFGFAFGADALIDLLGTDDQIPEEEVVRSLESISGLAHGADVERWRFWYHQMPGEITGTC